MRIVSNIGVDLAIGQGGLLAHEIANSGALTIEEGGITLPDLADGTLGLHAPDAAEPRPVCASGPAPSRNYGNGLRQGSWVAAAECKGCHRRIHLAAMERVLFTRLQPAWT